MQAKYFAFLTIFLIIPRMVLAQGSTVHDLQFNVTSPLPDGSCIYVDEAGGLDRKWCSNWAAGIKAWSTILDVKIADSIFQLPPSDAFKIVYRNNHVAQPDTIVSAATTGASFGLSYFSVPQGNSINPQGGSLINGVLGYTFGAKQGAMMFSDGAGYLAFISLPMPSSQDGTQVLGNDNIYRQIGPAQLAPGAVTTPALASGLNLASPTFTFGSDAPGDLYVRGVNGLLTRLPPGATNAVLAISPSTNTPAYQTTLSPNVLPIATNASNGVGRPDGAGLTVDAGGTWHSTAGIDSVADNVTALGTGQSDCAQLTTRVTYLTAGVNDAGVCLVAAVKGSEAHVCNVTGNEYFVYPMADGSSINDNPGTTPVIVGRGCVGFLARSSSAWWTTGPRTPLLVK